MCSCLENSRDRGAWWAIVHGFAKSGTWLRDQTFLLSFVCPSSTQESLKRSPLCTHKGIATTPGFVNKGWRYVKYFRECLYIYWIMLTLPISFIIPFILINKPPVSPLKTHFSFRLQKVAKPLILMKHKDTQSTTTGQWSAFWLNTWEYL